MITYILYHTFDSLWVTIHWTAPLVTAIIVIIIIQFGGKKPK